ncbi:hypothetical protein TruAng_011009 [Truncatella angustata]|nr:hypothetical protein TruAng_011009 [Truncatella angustata]
MPSDVENAMVLCQVLANSTIQLKLGDLASILGVHQGSTSRKINAAVKPYGFEFKEGKVVKVNGSTNVNAGNGNNSSSNINNNDEASAATSKKPARGRKRANHAMTKAPVVSKKQKSKEEQDGAEVDVEDGIDEGAA